MSYCPIIYNFINKETDFLSKKKKKIHPSKTWKTKNLIFLGILIL